MTAPLPLPADEAIRPLPKHLEREHWNDVPAKIAQAFGGRNWFKEEEARFIHRIGIGRGLGWRLADIRSDGIDYVQITMNTDGRLDMLLSHVGDRPSEEAELIKAVGGLRYADLRRVYDEEMV